jgi:uncharacterized repeat protein (TIGR01451 family)
MTFSSITINKTAIMIKKFNEWCTLEILIMRKSIFPTIIALFCASAAFAQNWKWTKEVMDSFTLQRLGTPDNLKVSDGSIQADPNENVVHIQSIRIGPYPHTPMIQVTKYDHNGNTVWVKYFKTPGSDNIGGYSSNIYDMKLDRIGNIYIIMRNFTNFDGIDIGNGSTRTCVVKLNPNGKFIWKKAIGRVEGEADFPANLRLAMSPTPDHFYMLVYNAYASTQVLDSVYTQPPGAFRTVICKVDSTGRLLKDLKIPNVTRNYVGFAVNNRDQVLVAGYANNTTVTIADTTLLFEPNNYSKTFYTLLRGSDLSRIWAKHTGFVTNVGSNNPMSAQFTSDGKIGILHNIYRSASAPVSNFMYVGTDTFSVNFPFSVGYPYFIVVDSTGKLFGKLNLSPVAGGDASFANISVDKQDNFYAGGTKAIDITALNRYVPVLHKISPDASLLWTATITHGDSSMTRPPKVAALADYPVMLTYSAAGFMSPMYSVYGPDTIFARCQDCPSAVLSALGGRTNTIRGKVFKDNNSNTIFDAGDKPFRNILVSANAGQFNTFTDAMGNYLLTVDSGNYNIYTPNRRFYRIQPVSYNLNFPNSGATLSNKDFAYAPDTNAIDVAIDVTAIGIPRPGQDIYLYITVTNNGVMPATGDYTLKLGNLFSYVQSDSIPVYLSADSVRWTYTGLEPEEKFKNVAKIGISTSAVFGMQQTIAASVTPYVPDTVKQDNRDTAFITIQGSFDPNDKQVFPKHRIRIDSIQTGKQTLEYTIRFQNTGNDTAFNIHLADTLPLSLDMTTFKLLSASHPVELEWKSGNVLHFYFRNILLPDSNRNEARSHGFVKFSMKPKPGLNATDSIVNKAAIYFDYNAPVITNRATSFFNSYVVTSIRDMRLPNYQLSLYPNPTSKTLHYSLCCFTLRDKPTLEISNLAGQVLLKRQVNPGINIKGSIDVSALPAGSYFLRINGQRGFVSAPFIKE